MANRKVDALMDKISDKSLSILFLADGLLYPVAHYGSLKMNEVLGIRSFHYSLQEYCHAPLFGLKKNDTVIILNGTEGRNGHAAKSRNKLFENLSRLNLFRLLNNSYHCLLTIFATIAASEKG